MLSIVPSTEIFLVPGATDMRKGFNTLASVVTNAIKKDPLSGVFVFCNRRRNRVKILFWDRGGFWLCAKRLEKGTFAWPDVGTPYMEMGHEELTLLLGGIDVNRTRHRRWYQRTRKKKNLA